MTEYKSQFVAGGEAGSLNAGYLGASLTLMCADTRSGVAPGVREAFAVVEAHAEKNPDPHRTGYVSRHKANFAAVAPRVTAKAATVTSTSGKF